MRLSHYAFALCLALLATPLAAEEVWTSIGPEGGRVTALAAAPSRPSVIYAGASYTGLYRSADQGQTWTRGGLRGDLILDLAVSPTNPRILYAATSSGLRKSTDGGATWSAPAEMEPRPLDAFVEVEVHPRNPAIVLAAAGHALYRSADRGRTWTAEPAWPDWVRVLRFAPSLPNVVYAGAMDGLWKSSDTGRTWRRVDPERTGISALAVDPRSHQTLHVGSLFGDILKSADGGATWRTGLAGDGTTVTSLVFDPADPSTLYAGRSGLLRSRNGGRTWEPVGQALPGAVLAAPQPLRSGLLVGTHLGLFFSANRGATFRPSQRGFHSLTIQGLETDRQDPARLYAATFDGVFKTRNRGAAWLRLAPIPGYGAISPRPVRIDPSDPERVYTTVTEGIARTTNGGRRWTVSGGLSCILPRALELDPHDPDVLYAWAAGLYTPFCPDPDACTFLRSLDAGVSWECIPDQTPAILLAVDPFTSEVYAGRNGQLWSSADHGTTWTPVSTARVISFRLTPSPLVPGTLWAPSLSGPVARSRDGGKTWEFFSAGLPREPLTLAADPVDPDVLYAASVTQGVFKSTDAGETWSRLGVWPEGVHHQGGLVIDPADPSILYAGTDIAGVLRLDQEE